MRSAKRLNNAKTQIVIMQHLIDDGWAELAQHTTAIYYLSTLRLAVSRRRRRRSLFICYFRHLLDDGVFVWIGMGMMFGGAAGVALRGKTKPKERLDVMVCCGR